MSGVFANGHEISAKKDSNQSVGAMPDVCLSPPSPPAGPIPIPYPNFAKGSDTSNGTKTVKIQGEEAGIKDDSDYKQSKGNEAATRSFGMGVVSHTISGKMQHARWSMDVKFEGKNVLRQLDLTTHNHGSDPGNLALVVNGGKWEIATGRGPVCKELDEQNSAAQQRAYPRRKVSPRTGSLPKNTVMVSAQYSEGGSVFRANAHNRSIRRVKNDESFVKEPLNRRSKNKKIQQTRMCEEAKAKLAEQGKSRSTTRNQGPMTHCESKIVEDLFRRLGPNPSGRLTLNIKWNKRGRPSTEPCEQHCKPMLCAAQACGLKIYLCRDGKSEKLECEE